MLALVLLGCGEGGGPTRPGGVLLGLRIKAPKTTINVGESVQMEAVNAYSDGREEAVTVVWSANPNGVASVSSNGSVIGVKLGVAAIAAHNGATSAVVAIRVVRENGAPPRTDLSGVWSGRVVVSECQRISGLGSSPCLTGSTQPFQLSLSQTGYSLRADVLLGNGPAVGSLVGWCDFTENLFLQGTLAGADGSIGTYEVTAWETVSDPPYLRMRGSFEVLRRFTNGFGPQVVRFKFTLDEVVR